MKIFVYLTECQRKLAFDWFNLMHLCIRFRSLFMVCLCMNIYIYIMYWQKMGFKFVGRIDVNDLQNINSTTHKFFFSDIIFCSSNWCTYRMLLAVVLLGRRLHVCTENIKSMQTCFCQYTHTHKHMWNRAANECAKASFNISAIFFWHVCGSNNFFSVHEPRHFDAFPIVHSNALYPHKTKHKSHHA